MTAPPPKVEARLDAPLRAYVCDRLEQVMHDRYAGLPLLKFPEDLRAYEHRLWECAPNVVIELGTWGGGSALWFRDRLATLARYGRIRRPLVISVDLSTETARALLGTVDPSYDATIKLVEGDILDPELPDRVAALLPDDASCFVVEDSAHDYATTTAALAGFARFVPIGGMFVVEDGIVDNEEVRPAEWWPSGVRTAIADWLATPEGSRFTVRRDGELYGVSCHPGGWLQRAAAAVA
jgi:cephalosporin hydroxylase